MTIISDLAKSLNKFTMVKSPAILTAIAVTGTVTTALLASQASFKAAKLIADEEVQRKESRELHEIVPEDIAPIKMDTNEKIALVWTLYIPAIGSGLTAVCAMIAATQIGNRRTVAAAAAYSLSEKAFGEYRGKIVDKIGAKKEEAARVEIAQERVNSTPGAQIVMINEGEVLCFDQYSGRYFKSDMETLKKAQNDLNYKIIGQSYASLNDFYDNVGLDYIPTGEELGWTTDTPLELNFYTVMSADQRPCIAFDFLASPKPNYFKAH